MITRSVLLLTKTDVTEPRDGGTLRVAAVIQQLRSRSNGRVDWVAVEGDRRPRKGPRVARGRIIAANFRVLYTYAQIGSLSAARWYRPRVVRELLALQQEVNYDVRLIEYSQLLGYRSLFAGDVTVDLHNIESELMGNYAGSARGLRALVARYEAWRLRRLESRIGAFATSVAVVSGRDRDTLLGMAEGEPPKVILAPNGVSDEGFTIEADRRAEVVFVGHLGWAPNVDAAVWLCREVWPRVTASVPQASLRIVGRSPSRKVLDLAGGSVTVHADVPTVVPIVARAAVATAPLLAAGGTRLKILEALSCGTPVVSTSLGALGLEAIDPTVLQVRDNAEDFAEAVVGLLQTEVNHADVRSSAEDFRWDRALAPLLVAVGVTS